VQKIVEKYSSSIAKVREFTETPKVCKELLKNIQVSNQNWLISENKHFGLHFFFKQSL